MNEFDKKDDSKDVIDYIQNPICYPLGMSFKTGYYGNYYYQFSDQSGQALANKMNDLKNQNQLQLSYEDSEQKEHLRTILKINKSFALLQLQTLFDILEKID